MVSLSALLQPELIAILISISAVVGVVLVVSKFAKESGVVQGRLNRVEAQLTGLRTRVEVLRESVRALKEQVSPLIAKEKMLRPYYDELEELLKEAREKEAEAEATKAIEVGGVPPEKKDKTIGKRKRDF